MEMYNFDDQKNLRKVTDIAEATWVHIENPSEEETRFITSYFNIPEDFIMDAVDPYEVPRKEIIKTKDNGTVFYLLFLFPAIVEQKKEYKNYATQPIGFIFVGNTLISVTSRLPEYLRLFHSKHSAKNTNPNDAFQIFLHFVWQLTDTYVKYLQEIDRSIMLLEKQITNSTENELFYKLIAIHKSLVYFGTAISRNQPLIEYLYSIEKVFSSEENETLAHDIIVVSEQAGSMADESNQMIDQLSEVFSSVISNNLNNIMKVLTTITIIMTIPTIIGAFWGMNVSLPLEDNPAAFWLILLLCIVISGITGYIFHKKKYF